MSSHRERVERTARRVGRQFGPVHVEEHLPPEERTRNSEDAYEERFRVLQAAYRLGGARALLPLLAPKEEIACPRCGGDGEDPERLVWAVVAGRPDLSTARPDACELCAGGGVVTRAVCRDSLRDASTGPRL